MNHVVHPLSDDAPLKFLPKWANDEEAARLHDLSVCKNLHWIT